MSTEDKKEVCLILLAVHLNLISLFQLKEARKEGRLSEAMLDRRSKLKRYASKLRKQVPDADQVVLPATNSAKLRARLYSHPFNQLVYLL